MATNHTMPMHTTPTLMYARSNQSIVPMMPMMHITIVYIMSTTNSLLPRIIEAINILCIVLSNRLCGNHVTISVENRDSGISSLNDLDGHNTRDYEDTSLVQCQFIYE